jgi:hypothetical protein
MEMKFEKEGFFVHGFDMHPNSLKDPNVGPKVKEPKKKKLRYIP